MRAIHGRYLWGAGVITPTIRLVAYEARDNAFIFVAIPDQRGRYVRTDRSVAFVSCSQCRATVGEPCKGRNGDGYGSLTHYVRRNEARKFWGRIADDVLENAPSVPDAWVEASA